MPAASAAELPPLTEKQAAKLKKLSVVTLASQSKSLEYEVLMKELEVRQRCRIHHAVLQACQQCPVMHLRVLCR